MSIHRIIAVVGLVLVAAIGGLAAWLVWRVPREAPPRANDRIVVPPQTSVIAVPISAPLGELSKALERAVPRALWTIDQPGQVCVPSTKVKVLFARIKTPTIKCRIVGRVTRGALALSGSGRTIQVTMPLHAVVSAQDIGGVLKRETATADARVRALIRLDLASDWSPRGTVSISYDWTDAPHIDFLGRRIEFTDKADAKLKGVIARLERTLPRELRKLSVRDRVAEAWRSAFTSLELNDADPPVWMRISPRDLRYGGYRVSGNRLVLQLGMTALTETFVGPRPADPAPIPLPPVKPLDEKPGYVLFAIPVIADYHELEPVLMRALVRRSARPFEVPGLGPVLAQFGSVTMYGTSGGRIAVGVTFSANRPGERASHGTVWLTARPINQPNSRRVGFADLSVAGVTDSTRSSLLIKLVNAPVLSDTIADALTQNFGKDYDRLLGKIGTALAQKRVGQFVLRAHIDDVRTGALQATGQGVYLAVTGKGTAAITLDLPGRP
ncbi:MAG: DUF4403 family protein [Sphingomonas sp.]|uniref:DUF4403 family protein n=1 Tax=Sphingomonas sp. TaxID=28214 RepID=UPI001AC223C3|nr:DUF4403 family protein [Sphingomonas sp.]MBN8809309.1 DUF4403 family protein [Sphingomonas sp.]